MKLSTHIVEKPWGRSDLPAIFGAPAEQRTGEVWFDHPGHHPLPMLVKWLFTSEKLSVQVHPSDAEAAARGMASGKEECWYVTDAAPGAVLGIGTKQPLTAAELRAASLSGEIETLLDWKPVKAGDWFYIPAGTVHAIGPGLTLVEVQQYADITYRLYDYGRLDKGLARELHLDDGVAVSKPVPYADARHGHAAASSQLVDGPHFRLWLVADPMGLAAVPINARRWVVPIAGAAAAAGDVAEVGECLLVEAGEPLAVTADSRVLIAA